MNNINGFNNLKNEFIFKKRRKSLRTSIVYNIGNKVFDYMVFGCNNVLNKSNKIAPDNQIQTDFNNCMKGILI
jgi:hypothetical protein